MFVAILQQDRQGAVKIVDYADSIMSGVDVAGTAAKTYLTEKAELLVSQYDPASWQQASLALRMEYSVHPVQPDGNFGDQLWSLTLTPAGFVVAADWAWQKSGKSLKSLMEKRG